MKFSAIVWNSGVGQTRREQALAMNAAAISGNTISWLSIISMTMTKAVIGAWVTPAKYATMPSMTVAPMGTEGKKGAMLAPNPAPAESVGAMSPPGIPLMYEIKV